MSQIAVYPAAGGGANVNLNNTFEAQGWATDGTLTLVTSGGSAGAQGSTATIGGPTANAWAGFWLYFGPPNVTSNRMLLDLFLNTVPFATGIFLEAANSGYQSPIWIPLAVPAGATITAKVRAPNATIGYRVALLGAVRNASSPPCYSTMVNLTADNANTRPSTVTVSFTAAGGTTFTPLVASTSVAYGAIMFAFGTSAATPVTSQPVLAILGVGANGSEVEIHRDLMQVIAGGTNMQRAVSHVIDTAVAINQRLSVRLAAGTPGSDSLSVGVYGFA